MSEAAEAYLKAKIDSQILRVEDVALVDQLVVAGQSHLFEAWDVPGESDERKLAMLDQLKQFDQSYPGGVARYVRKDQATAATT